MELWEKAGEKSRRPRLAYENHAMPVFYRDVMYREGAEAASVEKAGYPETLWVQGA